MSKVNQIKKWIEENNPKNAGDLFAYFRLDIDSLLIASYLLDLETSDLVDNIRKTTFTEEDLINRIDEYIDDPKLFRLIVPRTVQTAIALFYQFQDEDHSKEIVLENHQFPNYVRELGRYELFDKDVVFFSTNIDINQDFLNIIDSKIKTLDVIFQEQAYKEIFKHFELVPFMISDKKSRDEFTSLINKNKEDSFYPIVVALNAKIIEDNVVYFFDTNYLEVSLHGLNSGINFKKLKENLIRETKSEIRDSVTENVIQLGLSFSMGFGWLDVGVKSVKIFLKSLYDSTSTLSEDQVNKDFVEFQESGFEDIKDWFYFKIKGSLKKAMEESGVDFPIDDRFIENSYSQFIKRYFIMYSLTEFPESMSIMTHTEIFKRVYDCCNNYTIRKRTGFF